MSKSKKKQRPRKTKKTHRKVTPDKLKAAGHLFNCIHGITHSSALDYAHAHPQYGKKQIVEKFIDEYRRVGKQQARGKKHNGRFFQMDRSVSGRASAIFNECKSKDISIYEAYMWAFHRHIGIKNIKLAIEQKVRPDQFDSWFIRYRGRESDLTTHIPDRQKSKVELFAAALANGKKWAYVNGTYYRYFEDGGWDKAEALDIEFIRYASRRRGEPWFLGPIISRNHGTVIVPPYIRPDRIHVVGYTKNPPGMGKAKPRKTPRRIGRSELIAMKAKLRSSQQI